MIQVLTRERDQGEPISRARKPLLTSPLAASDHVATR